MRQFAYILCNATIGWVGIPVLVTRSGKTWSRVVLRRGIHLPEKTRRNYAGDAVRVPTTALQFSGDRLPGVWYQPAENGFGKRAMGKR